MALPRTLSLVWHRDDPYPREVAVERVYRDLEVAGSPARPRVIANMVQTLDGVVAVDGTAWTIGSDVDHYLFRTLRGWADAVLCGAGTLRRNDVVALTHPELRDARAAAGRTPNPAAVVVTRLAEFSDAVLRKRFFTRREFASVVVATDRAPAPNVRRAIDAGADVVIVPAGTTGEADPVAWLEALRARGFERILLEGGPLTNRAMVHAGVVEELFVTVTSRVAGRPDGVETRYGIFGGASASLEPISEYRHEAPGLAEWYLRSRVTPSTDR